MSVSHSASVIVTDNITIHIQIIIVLFVIIAAVVGLLRGRARDRPGILHHHWSVQAAVSA